jgi:putative Mn2+ efflux pump MntP
MPFIEVLVIALALSLDAFAVSLATSASGFAKGNRATFRLAFHFGLFQCLMLIVGGALGMILEPAVAQFAYWVAFGLLAIVGLRMIRSALAPEPEAERDDPSRGWALVILAIATSTDAMAVGLSMSMLRMAVWYPSIVAGIVTAIMSIAAITAGRWVGAWVGKRAKLGGGVVLLLIALAVVISHTV